MLSYPKEKIKIVLLEGIHSTATETLKQQGFSDITTLPGSFEGDELIEKIKGAQFIGIRSKTQMTAEILEKCPKLMAIGCFCIGSNQVDLPMAAAYGIPVFNAPHSNTRSVAELVIGLTIMLLRNIFPKNSAAHAGKWLKTAKGSFEARGKSIGIVGYGHIGSQVSVLAEALGMQVYYYDIKSKLPIGNAQRLSSLEELLQRSHIVTLHVPETEKTRNMIGNEEIKKMRRGSSLINASRGNVVDIEALKKNLEDEHLNGAAIDVYPEEPKSTTTPFHSSLQSLDSAILTPHIGGSTQEAQENIGIEVSRKLAYYCDRGSTEGALNFPELSLTPVEGSHRILHTHKNIPGMLQQINKIIADEEVNILGQYLLTHNKLGYVVLDIEKSASEKLLKSLKEIEGTIRARVLY